MVMHVVVFHLKIKYRYEDYHHAKINALLHLFLNEKIN